MFFGFSSSLGYRYCSKVVVVVAALWAPVYCGAAGDSGTRWHLGDIQVLDAGQTHQTPEGVFHDGLTLEAKAAAPGAALLQQARLILVLQSFSPARTSTVSTAGAQQAGRWYVKGVWALDPPDAERVPPFRAWSRPGGLQGRLNAELDFNPALDARSWSARLTIPSGHIHESKARAALRGQGVLNLDGFRAGELALDLRQGTAGHLR